MICPSASVTARTRPWVWSASERRGEDQGDGLAGRRVARGVIEILGGEAADHVHRGKRLGNHAVVALQRDLGGDAKQGEQEKGDQGRDGGAQQRLKPGALDGLGGRGFGRRARRGPVLGRHGIGAGEKPGRRDAAFGGGGGRPRTGERRGGFET